MNAPTVGPVMIAASMTASIHVITEANVYTVTVCVAPYGMVVLARFPVVTMTAVVMVNAMKQACFVPVKRVGVEMTATPRFAIVESTVYATRMPLMMTSHAFVTTVGPVLAVKIVCARRTAAVEDFVPPPEIVSVTQIGLGLRAKTVDVHMIAEITVYVTSKMITLAAAKKDTTGMPVITRNAPAEITRPMGSAYSGILSPTYSISSVDATMDGMERIVCNPPVVNSSVTSTVIAVGMKTEESVPVTKDGRVSIVNCKRALPQSLALFVAVMEPATARTGSVNAKAVGREFLVSPEHVPMIAVDTENVIP